MSGSLYGLYEDIECLGSFGLRVLDLGFRI